MAGRKLKDLPPETPFLMSRNVQPADGMTPVIKGFAARTDIKQMSLFAGLGRNEPAKDEQKVSPFSFPAFKKHEPTM